MPDNTHTDDRSPEQIEHEIRSTQRDMSRTVEQLQDRMSGRNMLDALLDRAEENGIDARYLLDAARRNPLALGLIAAGGLWLVSDADARPSALRPNRGKSGSDDSDSAHAHGSWHSEHQSYLAHMNQCERRPDEDDLAYRRRRDMARASYFMIEQGHDEDEHSFRSRLDQATEQMRERRHQAAERARDMSQRSRDKARAAASQARGLYQESPLVGGLAAAFVGAIAGAALPVSRTEEEYLGTAGEKALDKAQEQGEYLVQTAREKKDDMVDKADEKMSSGSGSRPQAGSSPGMAQI